MKIGGVVPFIFELVYTVTVELEGLFSVECKADLENVKQSKAPVLNGSLHESFQMFEVTNPSTCYKASVAGEGNFEWFQTG